jgi:hypothetical protein
MTDTTPNLALPELIASQAQKHVTVNEALSVLDTLVQLAVLDRDLAAPPASPAEGERWLVAAGAAGGWSGHDGAIAAWQNGAWAFYAPRAGWTCYVADEATLLVYDGAAWQPAAGSALQNLGLLGIGTAADAANPLAAKLNNALFAARTVAEGGDGTLRYKLSKEDSAKTASFLFQDNYSGRAEFGLTGDDDFHIKVSPDGVNWVEAVKVDRADGTLSFPASGTTLRQCLTTPRTYYVDAALGSDGNDGLGADSSHAFASLQHALDVVFGMLDLGGQDVTIQLADGAYSSGWQASPQVGAGTISVVGNAANPANVTIAATAVGEASIRVDNGASLTLADFTVSSTHFRCLNATRGGSIIFSNLRIGASGEYQVRASDLGYVQAVGAYTIVGGGSCNGHLSAVGNGIIRIANSPIITIEAPHTYADAFAAGLTGANLICTGVSFTGAGVGFVTGKTYNVQSNSILQLGASTLPGSMTGTTTSGGQVV